ncbi:MAG: selenocysteine-specific elongation factor [Clostridiales bacterium]|nr:selenocysteine-specific elongation factor [Clostridiales bacterium]MDK2932878.1 selenocysteine-specific elongation factor [Clostridiales bacterium]
MGTAGHVDHGKTTLVKRLTDIDTDRLAEEKKRGMTIELGFAPFQLPNGIVVSIIDVPGHERFVKTMLSGITGIDFVVLVVAADEGVMPQTKEHLDILSLLGIKWGIVAVTKSDLVDEEWLGLVKQDIEQMLEGTTLENAPIIPISSLTGEGIEQLIHNIEQLALKAGEGIPSELFRLPIDRVFTKQGYGTIVTGTLSGGKVSKGDRIEILPQRKVARIRGIQVHNMPVESASAGERCALNIVGIEKSEIERGNTIAYPGVIQPTKVVDAVLHIVKGEKDVCHNQRVHVHMGTQEAVARIRVIGANAVSEGQKGYVQLRFEKPVAALRGDRFIIRSYSPIKTIGGGSILLSSVHNRARFSDESIAVFNIEENGDTKEILNLILKNSGLPLSLDELWRKAFINKSEIKNTLIEMIDTNQIIYFRSIDKFLSTDKFQFYADKINAVFEKLYHRYPFRFKVDKEEMKSKLFRHWDGKDFNALIDKLIENGLFIQTNNMLMQPGANILDRINRKKEVHLIEQAFLKDQLNVRRLQQIFEDVHLEDSIGNEVVNYLVEVGKLLRLGDGIFLHSDVFKNVREKIKNILLKKESITVAELRDDIKTNRKLAIALMEFLDHVGFTQRVGDKRYPGPEFKKF